MTRLGRGDILSSLAFLPLLAVRLHADGGNAAGQRLALFALVLMIAHGWAALFAYHTKRPIGPGLIPYALLFVALLPGPVPWGGAVLAISFGSVFGREIFGGKAILPPTVIALAFALFSFPKGGFEVLGLLSQPPDLVFALSCLPGAALLAWYGGLAWRVVAGAVLGLLIVNLVPFETPVDSWFIFLSGALAICAMILPGISGSFILLLLRKYEHVFNGIGHFDFSIIVPFALGAATGLMLFSRILTWLLRHYYRVTISTIIGMLIGSLWLLWPFQARSYEVIRGKQQLVYSTPIWPAELGAGEFLAIALCIVGIAIVFTIERLARREQATGHGLL